MGMLARSIDKALSSTGFVWHGCHEPPGTLSPLCREPADPWMDYMHLSALSPSSTFSFKDTRSSASRATAYRADEPGLAFDSAYSRT